MTLGKFKQVTVENERKLVILLTQNIRNISRDIFGRHKLKPMYMYLRLVSGRERRTHNSDDSALNARDVAYKKLRCICLYAQTINLFLSKKDVFVFVVPKKVIFDLCLSWMYYQY